MKPCDHDSRPVYEKLIGPMRDRARELGYALTVHGTLKRDIDLVGVPWTEEAVPEPEFAEAMRLVAEEVHGQALIAWSPVLPREMTLAGFPGRKPHGRLVWNYVLGGGPYIDLSVMPRVPRPPLED